MKYIALVATAIVIVAAVVILINRKMGKNTSPYVLFAIVDIIFGLGCVGFAIYDFKTAVGEFAGILGTIVLYIGGGTALALLIIDIIVWMVNKRSSEK